MPFTPSQRDLRRGSGRPSKRLAAVLAAFALALAACGSSEQAATDAAAAAPANNTSETTAVAEPETPDDGEDEDHGDEDHDDEDHDDEDHGDEDHDEDDHDDEDHSDEDHDEDDHDDHDHDDEGSSGLGAHEHGTAELSVAWIDTDVVVDLISPTQNVFGFEYEPETEEDLATVADRTEALTAEGIITINDDADCQLAEPAATETEREGSHSEITVSWSFTCSNPDDLTSIDLSALFAEFPGFEDIDAEWVSATSQSSAELTPEQTSLILES